jgi:hypothetical protein
MARQIETAQRLRDDLAFLADRSDRLAERLESAVRTARMVADSSVLPAAMAASLQPRPEAPTLMPPPQLLMQEAQPEPAQVTEDEPQPRLRSQAERDLLRALRGVR